jgi:hypothetical protein
VLSASIAAIIILNTRRVAMRHFIHRYRKTGEVYGIRLEQNGAVLYEKGLGLGSFIGGEFSGKDLDKIVEQHLSELAEIFRLLEELDEKELDPSWW